MAVHKSKTKSGFEFSIPDERIFDMRTVDALVAMEDASLSEETRSIALVRAIRFLLGDKQKDALYAHISKEKGVADPYKVGQEFKEILLLLEGDKKK